MKHSNIWIILFAVKQINQTTRYFADKDILKEMTLNQMFNFNYWLYFIFIFLVNNNKKRRRYNTKLVCKI